MNHTTKKITLSSLTILMAFISFSSTLQADSNPFRANHHNQKNKSGIIQFTPDNAFGGIDATGSYKKRGKTASIAYDQTTYEFNKIIEDPNPKLTKDTLHRVVLGFFSDHTNSKDMPVTSYIFGSPINDAAKKATQTAQLVQLEKSDNDSDNDNDTNNKSLANLQRFKPAKQFAGHDLIGAYDNSTHEAMINDPSGKNNKRYAFINVQEGMSVSQTSSIEKPILIGSYTNPPKCSKGTPQVCSNAIRVVSLYGNLQQ